MRTESTQSGMTRPSDAAWHGDGAPARDARLRALADDALRRACGARQRADHADRAERNARDVMRRVCEVAHERSLRAEQLLLLLKEAWRELPEARRLPSHVAGDVLTRAITGCIDEFYAGGDGRR